MQTFLPYADFAQSARVLDRQRLGKQRVETLQIARCLEGSDRDGADLRRRGWANHPAVKMWRGYEGALVKYQSAVCLEWMERGYRDTCLYKTLAVFSESIDPQAMPPWLGYEPFHASHRSNLLRKAPDHYGQFGWTEPDDLEYVWPIWTRVL